MSPSRGLTLLALLLTAGCEGGERVDPPRIVLSPAELVVSFPASDSDSEILARAVSLDHSDGRLVVGDRMTQTVVVFDEAGRIRQRMGREGEGPGEFRRPGKVLFGPDRSIWVSDQALGRISRFSSDGEFLSSVAAPSSTFAVIGHEKLIAPAPADGVLAFLIDGDSVRPWRDQQIPISRLKGLSKMRVVRYLLLAGGGEGLFFWDNLEGGLWFKAPPVGEGPVHNVSPPDWFLESARELRDTRRDGFSIPRGSTVLVPLIQEIHALNSNTVWLSAGWSDLIGMAVPTMEGRETVAVVPSDQRENRGMVDSFLANDSTLFALYQTEVRVYRLREEPNARGPWSVRE